MRVWVSRRLHREGRPMSRYDCRAQGCEWRAGEEEPRVDLVAHAQEAGHWLCVVCALSLRPDEPLTCARCLARVREHLSEIVEKYALLPGVMVGGLYGEPGAPKGEGQVSTERPLPGGDTLALLSGGSAGKSGAFGYVLPNGERDYSHAADELPGDPQSVAWELARWEDDWRLMRGEPAATKAATVSSAAGYLEVRSLWASNTHPAFDEFAADLRKLRGRLRATVGIREQHDYGAPCFEPGCGERLERQWTGVASEEGDVWACPKCGEQYTYRRYWQEVRQAAS